jgi:hypothetical protein
METGSPAPDEPVIRKFDRIIINGVRHELLLTSKRIIITGALTGTVRRNAEYSEIVLANLGVNNLQEPEISLSFAVGGGELETEELFFVHLPAGQNVQAADKCMDLLKDQGVPVRRSTTLAQMGPPSRTKAFTPSDRISAGRPAVPDFSVFGPTYSKTNVPDNEPREVLASPLVVGGLVLAVIIMIVAIAAIGGLPGGGKTLPVTSVVTPAMTIATTAPTPVATPVYTIEPTPQPPVTPAPPPIPENGIWLYVSSPGNYIGWIKAGGWTSEINATGTSLTQIATQNTLIEGSIEKTDGTGNPLEVKLYNGGDPVFEESLTKPYGMIQVRQTVGPTIIKNPSATPVPTPTVDTIPTPDPSIILKPVPSPGVFVRVLYDGEFSGSVSTHGIERKVSGSGDQYYQVLATSTQQVDGIIEKPDGSGKSLVVQLYKDGSLITAYGTSKPYGVVEFHTVV